MIRSLVVRITAATSFSIILVLAAVQLSTSLAGEPGNKPKLESRKMTPASLPAGAVARLGTTSLRDCRSVVVSPDGKSLLTCSGSKEEGRVIRWDAQTGEFREIVYQGNDVRAVAIAPDGKMMAVAAQGGLYIRDGGASAFKEFLVPGYKDRYPFYALCFSPDGKTIAGGGNDGVLQLCWPREQIELCRLRGLTHRIQALEYSRDGKLLACTSKVPNSSFWGEDIHIFDVKTRRVKQVLKGHETGVSALCVSPDGKTLASCGDRADQTVRLWDIATGKELWRQNACARGLAFSPDGKSLAVGGSLESFTRRDSRTGEDFVATRPAADLSVRDSTTGKERFHVTAHTDFITSVSYFPDGKRIVTAGQEGIVKVWDAATGKLLLPRGGHEGGVMSLVFSPDGKALYSRGMDLTLRRWNVPSGKEQDKLLIPTDRLGSGVQQWGYLTSSLALAPNGKQLALAVESERSVQLYESDSLKQQLSVKVGKSWGLRSASISHDGTLVISTSPSDLRVWSTKTGELVRPLALDAAHIRPRGLSGYQCAVFSPTRPLIAVGARSIDGGVLDIWDASSWQNLIMLDKMGQRVDHVAFSADGNLLAACGGDKNPVVAVYEVATGSLLGQFKLPEGTAHSAAFSPDGRLLAAGGDGGKNAVHLWDVYTGKELAHLEGHSAGVLSVAFSPDGKLLASGSLDTTILLWDVHKAIGKRTAPAESEKLPERCWDDLADTKAGIAALTALVRSPDRAVKLLKEQLKPAAEPDAKQVRTLIARLDDAEFAVREQASADLAKLGDVIQPALKAALDKGPSAEAKRRLEVLLATFDDNRPSAGRLREVRAVQTLEVIASPEARELLEALSRGAPTSRLTRDAKAALGRLARRPKE